MTIMYMNSAFVLARAKLIVLLTDLHHEVRESSSALYSSSVPQH